MAKDRLLCPHPDCSSQFTTSNRLAKHVAKQHNNTARSESSDSQSDGDITPAPGVTARPRSLTVPPPGRESVLNEPGGARVRFEGIVRRRPLKDHTGQKGQNKATVPSRPAPFLRPTHRRRSPTPPPRLRKIFQPIAMGKLGDTAGSSSAVFIDLRTPSLTPDTGSSSSSDAGSDAFGLFGKSAVPVKKVDIPQSLEGNGATMVSRPTSIPAADRASTSTTRPAFPVNPAPSAPLAAPVTHPKPPSSSPLAKKPSWVVRTPSPITLVDRRPTVNNTEQNGSSQSEKSDADDDKSESGSDSDDDSGSDGADAAQQLQDDTVARSAGTPTPLVSQNTSFSGVHQYTANKAAPNKTATRTTSTHQPASSAKIVVSSSDEEEVPPTPSKPPIKAVPRRSPPLPAVIRPAGASPNALQAFRMHALEEPVGSFLGTSNFPAQPKISGSAPGNAKPLKESITPAGTANLRLQTPSVPVKVSPKHPETPRLSHRTISKGSDLPARVIPRSPQILSRDGSHTELPLPKSSNILAGNTHKVLGAIARFLLDLSEIANDADQTKPSNERSGLHTPVSDVGTSAGVSRGVKRIRVQEDKEEDARSERVRRLTEDLRGVTGL